MGGTLSKEMAPMLHWTGLQRDKTCLSSLTAIFQDILLHQVCVTSSWWGHCEGRDLHRREAPRPDLAWDLPLGRNKEGVAYGGHKGAGGVWAGPWLQVGMAEETRLVVGGPQRAWSLWMQVSGHGCITHGFCWTGPQGFGLAGLWRVWPLVDNAMA